MFFEAKFSKIQYLHLQSISETCDNDVLHTRAVSRDSHRHNMSVRMTRCWRVSLSGVSQLTTLNNFFFFDSFIHMFI